MRYLFQCFIISFPTLVFAQQSVYDCNITIPPYTTQELEDPGFVEDEQSCFIFNEATNYNYPDGVNKDLKAYDKHRIEPNFRMGSSPGSGRFTLEMGLPYEVDVVLIEPQGIHFIPKYEKMELGIKIPEDLRERIDLFKHDKNAPNGINPYLSWEFKITATFSHEFIPVPTYPQIPDYVKHVDGFYYEEFERNIQPYTGPPGISDAAYPNFGGTWDSVYTDFPFRIRFSPPFAGSWKCSILLETTDTSFEYPEFEFNVIESGNPGFVKVGDNHRYLKLGNETYYPFGPNLPYPETLPELNPQTAAILGPSESYRPTVAPLQSYLDYEENIIKLADEGATHFRMILIPSSLDIEFEEIGNYNGRMHIAHEIDRILNLCDSLGIKVQFNMLIHYVLNQNVYHIKHWDWAIHDAYGSQDFSNNHPQDSGYCYHQNEYFTLNDPYEFITNEQAQKFYKEKLRYIVSRWGYSTEIEMFELMSEINQVGDAFDLDLLPLEEGVYQNYLPGFETQRINFQNDVWLWHHKMASYIKDTLEHDWHIINPCYAGRAGANDFTYNDDIFDINSGNQYNFFNNVSNLSWYTYLTSSPLGPPGQAGLLREYLNKPFIFSETGPANIEGCDSSGFEFQTNLWMSLFSGVALANDWDAWIRPQHWHYYGDIADFLDQFNIDLDGGNWQPGYILSQNARDSMESNNKKVETLFLFKEDKTEAIGIIRNRTVNYNTKPYYPDNYPSTDSCGSQLCNCGFYPWYWDTNDETFYEYPFNSAESLYPYTGNKVFLADMGYGPYLISYYNINDPNTVVAVSAGAAGLIELQFPLLDVDQPVVLFHMYVSSGMAHETNSVQSQNADDPIFYNQNNTAEIQDEPDQIEYQIYPNPSTNLINISCNTNGYCTIYNPEGKKIRYVSLNSGVNEIPIDKIEPGMYIFEIQLNNEIRYEKVIVK